MTIDDTTSKPTAIVAIDGTVYALSSVSAVQSGVAFGDTAPTVRISVGGKWVTQSRFQTKEAATAHAIALTSLLFPSVIESVVENPSPVAGPGLDSVPDPVTVADADISRVEGNQSIEGDIEASNRNAAITISNAGEGSQLLTADENQTHRLISEIENASDPGMQLL